MGLKGGNPAGEPCLDHLKGKCFRAKCSFSHEKPSNTTPKKRPREEEDEAAAAAAAAEPGAVAGGAEAADGGEASSDEEEDQDAVVTVSQGGTGEAAYVSMTEAEKTDLRRKLYLTIMSAASFEECAHKIMKLQLPEEESVEIVTMILECCSQERSYQRFYGLLG